MEPAEIVPLFLLLISQTSGFTSTVVHLPDAQSTSSAHLHSREDSDRSPKQHAVTQNIYPSTNYIKSTFHQNDPQPQLFNVGYSVRFENQSKKPKQHHQLPTPNIHQVNPKHNHGDIITGTRKQNVHVDAPVETDETSFRTQKNTHKRKVFNSAQTSQNSGGSINSKSVLEQVHVSPTTQRNLEVLENLRDVDYQKDLSELYQSKYTWKNLSPNVKIIRSTEVPFEESQNSPQIFDHEKALAKSEGFGFSDAIKDGIGTIDIETMTKTNNRHLHPPSEQQSEVHIKEPVEESATTAVLHHDQEIHIPAKYANAIIQRPQEVQMKPQTQTVQILPSNIFQNVEQIPIMAHPQFPPQIPKQVIVQYKKIPIGQFESTKKIPGKIKYLKQVPIRGNLHYTRKYVTNLDFPRKTKMKPQLRRDYALPSEFIF